MRDRSSFSEQFQLAVQSSGADWCARLLRAAGGWQAESFWGDRPLQQLAEWIADPAVESWLDGAIQSGRVRSRRFKHISAANELRMTAFPAPGGHSALLVASHNGGLAPVGRAIFTALTRSMSANPDSPAEDKSAPESPSRSEFMRIAEQLGSLDITELDLESVLRRSVERARELVHGESAELGLLDAAHQVVRVLLSDGSGHADQQYSVTVGQDLIGRVAAAGEPLVVNDYAGWPDRVLDTCNRSAVVGVPLKYKGAVIGALLVGTSRAGREFSAEDTQLLELLATQVSISIRNAHLFQELGERIEAQRAAESKIAETARLAAIGEMAASIAHELNNPLTAITGFSELLLDEFPPDSPQHENMALVLQEARRAREVVRRLLDFSRRENHLRTEVNITEAVSEVLALVQPLAQVHRVEIQFEGWEDLPRILGDRSQLRQVFLNLVTNAIQAIPGGGQVLVQTALEEGPPARVSILVRDTGVGIPAHYQPHIFEPFFTTKPVGSGTGLGLSISRNIVTDHGGEIRVASVEGQGASFTVLLPVAEAGYEHR